MEPEEKDLFGNPIAPAPADCLKLKQFQVSGKIIKLPFSVWKDGRMRVDVSAFGKGEVVSRNKLNLTKRVREILANALAETDDLIAAGKFDPQPRERNKRVACSSEVSEAAGQLFFRPADYKGLFSNCPGPVDSMLGPTHLEKRLFGLAWAKAVYTRLEFYELSLNKAARQLGATPRGIKEAAYSLRDRWRLFWFKNIRLGRFGGALVRFPQQDWMGLNAEHSSSDCLVAKALEKKEKKEKSTMARTGSKCSLCRLADARVFGDDPDLQLLAPCSACADKLAAERLAEQNCARLAQLTEGWSKFPALYRATDSNHPHVNRRILAEVLKYDPRSSNGKGIGLYGPTGAGKTRMMFLLVRELHFSGVKILFTSAIAIARASSQEFDDDPRTRAEARILLRNAAGVEVLFTDDIGKERLTEAAELKLYWLIEHRTANARPILWTSNFVGADLRKMMSDNRGSAITRRLAEFSSVLFVPAPYVQENERRFA